VIVAVFPVWRGRLAKKPSKAERAPVPLGPAERNMSAAFQWSGPPKRTSSGRRKSPRVL